MASNKLRKIHVHFAQNPDEHSTNSMKESQAFIRKLKSENRENNFDLVKSILRSMNSVEIRFAKNYLMMLHRAEFEVHALKLFRYLLDNPSATEAEARKDFLRENPKSIFEKAVSTLKKRLGWSLVSEYNTQREDAYSYKWKVTFEVMNNLALYYVIISRPLSGYAFDLLSETILKAKEVEAYREVTAALELKIRHVKARSESRVLTRLEKEVSFYRNCDEAVKEANAIYYHIGAISRKQGISIDELLIEHQTGLKSLELLHEQTNSETILGLCLVVKAAIFQLKNEYTAAGKIFHKLHDLTVSSPTLNSKRAIGIVLGFLAENYLKKSDFDVALTYCKKTKSFFDEGSFNYFQTEFLEFHCYFYTNQFYRAEKKMQGILSNPNLREAPFLINTKKYLLACSLFAQAKYKESLAMLVNLEKIWNDTTGWNVGIRMLIMLCYKMLGDYDLMAIERERFRQLFDKYRHRTAIRERDRIILKIIHEFLKRNCDFKSVLERKQKLFELLSSPKYKWEIMTHEMIVFEQWFICMANKTAYKSDL